MHMPRAPHGPPQRGQARGGRRGPVATPVNGETMGMMRRANEAMSGKDSEEKSNAAENVLYEAKGRILALGNTVVGSRAIEKALGIVTTASFQAFCAEAMPHLVAMLVNQNGSHVVETMMLRAFSEPRDEVSVTNITSAFATLPKKLAPEELSNPYVSFVLRKALDIPELNKSLGNFIVSVLRGKDISNLIQATIDKALVPLMINKNIRTLFTVEELINVCRAGFDQGEKDIYVIESEPCAICVSALVEELGERGKGDEVVKIVKELVLIDEGKHIHNMLGARHSSFLIAAIVKSLVKGVSGHVSTVDDIFAEVNKSTYSLEIRASFITFYSAAARAPQRKGKGGKSVEYRDKIDELIKSVDIESTIVPIKTREIKFGEHTFKADAKYDMEAIHYLTAVTHCATSMSEAPAVLLTAQTSEDLALFCNSVLGSQLVIDILMSINVPFERRLDLASSIAVCMNNLLSNNGYNILSEGLVKFPPGTKTGELGKNAVLKSLCKLEEDALISLQTASFKAKQGVWYKKSSELLDLYGYEHGKKVWREDRRAKHLAQLSLDKTEVDKVKEDS